MKGRPVLAIAGVLVLLGALSPPVDDRAAELFSVHMLQHMAIVLIAAPLIVAARLWRVPVRSVVVVGLLHVAALWAWHMPVLYDAAMDNVALHVLEHVSFLLTAFLFWNIALDAEIDRFKRVGLVFATMLQSSALGALIAFATEPLYEWHVAHTPAGYDVLGQQQVAGAIMWVPPGGVYLCVMLALLYRALSTLDAAEQQ